MSDPVGVYIHIPYCSGKCAYCDFYSSPGDPAEMDAYTAALEREIRALGAGRDADTVYFGGGTPSLVGAANLERILGAVREGFRLTGDAEITLEANPGDLCVTPGAGRAAPREFFARVFGAGFNRVSLGMQSSRPGALKALGRRHTPEDTAEAVAAAREAGFMNLSLDLIYALPGQRREEWEADLAAAVGLAPDHVSCYALTIEPGTPIAAREREVPCEERQLLMYLRAGEVLEAAGIYRYEISNFARPGMESRHNSRYWDGRGYLGFGSGAHSFDRGARYSALPDRAAYAAGRVEYTPRREITPRERLFEYVMLGLRTSAGIDPGRLPEGAAGAVTAIFKKYEPLGLTLAARGRLSLTPRGMFVSNHIIGEAAQALPDEGEEI